MIDRFLYFDFLSLASMFLRNFEMNNAQRKMFLRFNNVFSVGSKLTLKVNRFQAKLRDDLRGFYKSYYTKNGVTKLIATTQFESESARTAFPCFDAPNFKAKFTVSITLNAEDAANEKLTVLSNMPEGQRTALPDGSSVILFRESPPMSTYLLAFIIGEFDYVETSEDDIRFRVYSLPGDGEKGKYQLEVARKITKFFNQYFNVKYALPKMDLIGLPDFRAGAMENWGLLTFRSGYLIVDNTTTQSQLESGAEVVAHEIAHQWTGNFITCKWWSHLWMNEGFATFLETLSLDAIHPEFNRWQAKLTNSIQPALLVDALSSSHPIVNTADSPSEIEDVFDSITYDKGGAFLYMLHSAIGAEQFKSWMRAYFKKHQYTNAETSDLFQVLVDTVPGAPSLSQLQSWTMNAGFPLITVREDGGQYSVEQKRFFSGKRNVTEDSSSDPVWWVPISIVSPDGKKTRFDLVDQKKSNALNIPSGSWIKLNAGQTGFYRVNYPTNLWVSLFKEIRNQNQLFTVGDRFGLVDDIFALGFAGELSITAAMRIVPDLKNEVSFSIWDALLSHLSRISGLIAKESFHNNFNRLVIDLVKNRYEQIGWDSRESDTNDDTKLRPLLLSAMTTANHEGAMNEALTRFDKFITDEQENNISPDIRLSIYKTVVRERGEVGYHQIFNRLQAASNTSDFNEFSRCMYALAFAKDPSLIKTTLEMSLSPIIRSQDTVYLIREVSRNPYGVDVTWDFVRDNYDAIVAKAGQRTVSSRLITGITSRFTTRTKYDEVKNFFVGRDRTQSLDEALETILVNEQFIKQNYNEIKQYLLEKFPFME